MLGNPKFKINDKVKFDVTMPDKKKYTLIGEIYVVDKYGTFFDESDVCYDVMAEFNGERHLFKHINERGVKKA